MDLPATLTHPDGREWVARTPGEYNQLVFGEGYMPAQDAPAEPVAPVPDEGPADGDTTAAAPAPVESAPAAESPGLVSMTDTTPSA